MDFPFQLTTLYTGRSMTKLSAWLGLATLALCASATSARAGDPLKPYVVLDIDTSGSMGSATGSGQPSCGGPDTRLNHARCAISNIVNSYGDIVFGLSRFRMDMSGSTTAATFPIGCSTAQSFCDTADHEFELLSPLVDGNNTAGGNWTNFSGNTCTATGTDPEIWLATGNTPIEGTLRGAKRYWQGLQATDGTTIWPAAQPGFDPIRTDPTKTSFLPNSCDPNPATCVTKSGAGDSFAVAAGVVTLTDAAALFTAADVGRTITIAGATTAANNGLFTITAF